MHRQLSLLISIVTALSYVHLSFAQCPDYETYSTSVHEPVEQSRRRLPWMRPPNECRTFISPEIERAISQIKQSIADPALSRLFENSYPNTLDTAIRWRGMSSDPIPEELTFIVTGDINAMWLRDSAHQLTPFTPLLQSSSNRNSLASLFRGAINLQARYIVESPYCNAFHAPPESGIPPASNGGHDTVQPEYDPGRVFECKYELDSLASFLMLSVDYFEATSDIAFFARQNSRWTQAIRAILDLSAAMSNPTYNPENGSPLRSQYIFIRQTTRGTETLNNDGEGNPVAYTGLVRSAFRPSDDATTYQFLVPANIMFANYLRRSSAILNRINNTPLEEAVLSLANRIDSAIMQFAVADRRGGSVSGSIFAYEVDGFGSTAIMDDANLPSLLGIPLFTNFSTLPQEFGQVYQNTRRAVLSQTDNPYFMRGNTISGVGSPHTGFGKAWPMALIVQAMTSNNENEIYQALAQLLDSTGGLGLIHESVDSSDESRWTRQWFSWANGMFGQLIVQLYRKHPNVLQLGFP